MFGKGKKRMSSMDKFITQKGMDVGNLKRAQGKPLKATEMKSSPLTVKPVPNRKMSPGKAGPVKIVGD